MAVSGCNHYITFVANANAAAPIHFQALVYVGIPKDKIDVISCRLFLVMIILVIMVLCIAINLFLFLWTLVHSPMNLP